MPDKTLSRRAQLDIRPDGSAWTLVPSPCVNLSLPGFASRTTEPAQSAAFPGGNAGTGRYLKR